MNFKRYLTILFSICAFTLSVFAYDCEIDGIYYYLDNKNKTASVALKTYEEPTYKGSVSIPNTITYKSTTYIVTSIIAGTFYNCSRLTSIEIPNSVTSIGEGAFDKCSSLTSVKIPDSVTFIDESIFNECI